MCGERQAMRGDMSDYNATGAIMRRHLIHFVFALIVFALPAAFLRPDGDTWTNVSDFPAYYAAAKLMSRGHAADVYRLDKLEAEIHRYWKMPDGRIAFIAEAPFFMPVFQPLAKLTPDGAALVSCILMIVATSAAVVVLSAALELSDRATMAVIALTAASGPYWESMHCGKPAPLMLLGLCCTMLLVKHYRQRSAALASLVCLVKWHEIMPFLAFAAGARKIAYVFWFICASLLLAVASLGIFGVEGWVNYFRLLSEMSKDPSFIGYCVMPTLRGQLCMLGLNWQMLSAFSVLAYGASLVYLARYAGRFADSNRWWVVGIACSSLADVAFGVHCHQYDVLLLVPAVCILIREAVRAKDRIMLGLVSGLILVYSLPVYVGIQYGFLSWLKLTAGRPNIFFVLVAVTTIYAFAFARRWPADARNQRARGNQVEDLAMAGTTE
jgi:hypothetical protein